MLVRYLLSTLLLSYMLCGFPMVQADDRSLPLDSLQSIVQRYERDARIWQYGWVGAHTIFAGISGVEAWRTKDSADRRLHVVSALTSAGAVWEMWMRPLYPLPTLGQDAGQDNDSYRLSYLADEVRERRSLKESLTGWAIGLIGGAIVAGNGGTRKNGVNFFLTSGLSTQLQVWTLPKGVVTDWERYDRESWLAKARSRSSIQLVGIQPNSSGIHLLWRFF